MVDPLRRSRRMSRHRPDGLTARLYHFRRPYGVVLIGAIQFGFILLGSGILIVTAVGIVQWGGNLPDPEEGVADKLAEA